MLVVSNGQFWLCTFALLIVWIIVLTTALANDNNVSSYNENIEIEVQNSRNCKGLCEHCGCLNFYCGEECICECNNDRSDTECIATMQTNARKLKIPFEILIQGPTANTFVRNALQFEQNHARKSLSSYRNKRSTVTIYKPNKDSCPVSTDEKTESSCDKNSLRTSLEKMNSNMNFKMSQERSKRSTNRFEWFSDLSNDLVRPAPLGGRKRKAEQSIISMDLPKRTTTTTASSILDKSWFSDNTRNILTPAPLLRQQIASSSNNNNNNNNNKSKEDEDEEVEEDVSKESYKLTEKRFPLRIKDTIRKFSESGLRDDLSNAFNMLIKDSANSAQEDKYQKDNRRYLQGQKHTNGFQEILGANDDVSRESYKLTERQIPLRPKDNIQIFSQSGLSDDLANAFDMFIKDSANSAQENKYQKDNRRYLQGKKHTNGFQEISSAKDHASRESYKLTEKRFPLRIKDTIRKFSESGLSDDLANAFDMLIKDSAETQKNKFQKDNRRQPETLKDGLHTKVFRDNPAAGLITASRPVIKKLPEFRIPWLRPMNFFKKVRENGPFIGFGGNPSHNERTRNVVNGYKVSGRQITLN